jgi:hypothetical protein
MPTMPIFLKKVQEMGHLRLAENKALLGAIQQADLDRMGKSRVDEMLMDNQAEMKQKILSTT